MHEREPQPEPERPNRSPRIWAASLSDYNAGRLHGAWIDAARDLDEIQTDINAMLAASIDPAAEEWAIHDYEGFGHVQLGEYERLEEVARVARGIVEHGPAYAAWINHHGGHPDDGDFEDHFQGVWLSVEEYAEQYADEVDLDRLLSEHLPGYLLAYIRFDAAAFGRDLVLGGDIFTVDTPGGGIWVFYAS